MVDLVIRNGLAVENGQIVAVGKIDPHSYYDAQAIGLLDRGSLATGCKADLNVIDYGRLRLIQRADGYEATGALPGRLVRVARAAPG